MRLKWSKITSSSFSFSWIFWIFSASCACVCASFCVPQRQCSSRNCCLTKNYWMSTIENASGSRSWSWISSRVLMLVLLYVQSHRGHHSWARSSIHRCHAASSRTHGSGCDCLSSIPIFSCYQRSVLNPSPCSMYYRQIDHFARYLK